MNFMNLTKFGNIFVWLIHSVIDVGYIACQREKAFRPWKYTELDLNPDYLE